MGTGELSAEQRGHALEEAKRLAESGVVGVDAFRKLCQLCPESREVALCEVKPCHLPGDVRVFRVGHGKLGKPLFGSVDLQLIEVRNCEIEQRLASQVLEARHSQQPVGPQLMAVRVGAFACVEGSGAEVVLDRAGDARPKVIGGE